METPQLSAFYVFTQFSRMFLGLGYWNVFPQKAFVFFFSFFFFCINIFFELPSPRPRHQFLDPSLRAAALLSTVTTRSISFNLNAALNAVLPLFSSYRVSIMKTKFQIKDFYILPYLSVRAFDMAVCDLF